MKQKAFTLIELLVVIAVIGVIASIVLVNLRGSREKARIARALYFWKNINYSLGAHNLAGWRFEDNMIDSSGYNNDCGKGGGPDPVAYSSPEIPALGKGIDFSGDYWLSCSNGADIGTDSFIFEAWIKVPSVDVRRVIMRKEGTLSGWHGELKIFEQSHGDGDKIFFYVTDGGGPDPVITRVSEDVVADNKWHHVAAVCDRTKDAPPDIYIDGRLSNGSAAAAWCSQLSDIGDGGNLSIGEHGGNYLGGIVDEIRIYNVAF
jgi:prepilin-type N-terminal cleavage/methylation domain-containing protein